MSFAAGGGCGASMMRSQLRLNWHRIVTPDRSERRVVVTGRERRTVQALYEELHSGRCRSLRDPDPSCCDKLATALQPSIFVNRIETGGR